jgi:SMI1 / KNR4 family (SUKH-1)
MIAKLTTLDQLLQRMEATGIATREDLQGCSAEEIQQLEHRYSVKLPRSYRLFLETMGHQSGRLFRYDHFAVTYESVLTLNEEERNDAKRAGGDAPNRLREILDEDGLIILGRLGEQFLFIRCAQGDASAVHYYNNASWETRQAYSSVLEWINEVCDECIGAVKTGYFDKYPEGTNP